MDEESVFFFFPCRGKDKDGQRNGGWHTCGMVRSEEWAAAQSSSWLGARASLCAGHFLRQLGSDCSSLGIFLGVLARTVHRGRPSFIIQILK
jgi:hypothetical protein